MKRFNAEEMDELFRGVKITFSKHCCSGLICLLPAGSVCECWRCRSERGLTSDEDTENEAKRLSDLAREIMRQRVRGIVSERRNNP